MVRKYSIKINLFSIVFFKVNLRKIQGSLKTETEMIQKLKLKWFESKKTETETEMISETETKLKWFLKLNWNDLLVKKLKLKLKWFSELKYHWRILQTKILLMMMWIMWSKNILAALILWSLRICTVTVHHTKLISDTLYICIQHLLHFHFIYVFML